MLSCFQEKVMMEQNEIFGDSDRPVTHRDIQEMKYLEMVIKETMRLYPPVPVFGRKLQRDFDVGE
jgi:cytochrome P450 family 4